MIVIYIYIIKVREGKESRVTLIKRVMVTPQSRHLSFLSAMVLPQLTQRVMCLQLLPYNSTGDLQPSHDDFSIKSNDISIFRFIKSPTDK